MCSIKSVRFNCPYGVKLTKGDIRGLLEVGLSACIGGWEGPEAIYPTCLILGLC